MRRGNEKGRVERAIQYLRHAFFAARDFHDLADLNRQALLWRDEVAQLRPWPGDDARRVAEAFADEQPRLLPLPQHPFATALVQPIRSDKTLYVRFDQNDYSLPPDYVRRPLTLVASPEFIRLLDGATEVARHARSYDRHQRIDDPAHLAAVVAPQTPRARCDGGGPTRVAPAARTGVPGGGLSGGRNAGTTEQKIT